ncbi:MAG: hypothetical protein KAI90_00745 [Desulfobulbaceae bacterium]|nr:hypothetical protein [Desulfobulbaceae bacterium]
MRHILLTLFFLLSLVLTADAAYEIVVVQDSRTKAYDNTLQGFLDICASIIPLQDVKSIYPGTITFFVLSDSHNEAEFAAEIKSLDPDLILTIGPKSLSWANKLCSTPIIYLLARSTCPQIVYGPNIRGVGMVIPPEKQLDVLLDVFPDIKRIGLVYDPGMVNELVTRVKAAADLQGITLVAEPVRSSTEAPKTIITLLGNNSIDAFWMLPDMTVVTPDIFGSIYFLSAEEKIPVLTFADKYLKHGATVSVSFDLYKMGAQAGEMAKRLLHGSDIRDLQTVPPQMYFRTNP